VKGVSHSLYLLGGRLIQNLRYVDDRVFFLPASVRQGRAYFGYSWPGCQQSSGLLRKLRECFPNLVAHVIYQYSHIDQVVVDLHRELASWIEDNAMPNLVDIE
jgi:hypothetical protein